jgi:hypothetical protein
MKQLRGTPLKRFLRSLPPPPPIELVVVCQSVGYPVNVGYHSHTTSPDH